METIFYDNKLNKIHTKITNISINEGDKISFDGITVYNVTDVYLLFSETSEDVRRVFLGKISTI